MRVAAYYLRSQPGLILLVQHFSWSALNDAISRNTPSEMDSKGTRGMSQMPQEEDQMRRIDPWAAMQQLPTRWSR